MDVCMYVCTVFRDGSSTQLEGQNVVGWMDSVAALKEEGLRGSSA